MSSWDMPLVYRIAGFTVKLEPEKSLGCDRHVLLKPNLHHPLVCHSYYPISSVPVPLLR